MGRIGAAGDTLSAVDSKSKSVVFLGTHFFSNVGWVFLITLMPRFLAERFKVPVDERGLMTTIPLFAASFGLIAGGWFTDRLTAAYGRRWGRSIPMGLFKLPCAVALLSCIVLPTAWAVTIALTLMAVFRGFRHPCGMGFLPGHRRQAGRLSLLGWGNMWDTRAGLAPSLMGLLSRGGWGRDSVLVAGSVAFILCGIAATLANANEPLFAAERQMA